MSSIFTNTSREVVRESVLAYHKIELAADALSQDMVEKKPEENKDVPKILSILYSFPLFISVLVYIDRYFLFLSEMQNISNV